MRFSFNFRLVLLAAALCIILYVQGCTIHFRAKDVEASSHTNETYELEKADWFCQTEVFRGKSDSALPTGD